MFPLGPRPIAPPGTSRSKPTPTGQGTVAFEQVLQQQLQTPPTVKLSAHAAARLRESRRQLTPQEMSRISQAVDQVKAKGGRESLFLIDNLALVVSVPNRTVITAVSGERMRENVFTNIDSAVIL